MVAGAGLVQLLQRNWPRIVQAYGALDRFIAANPGLPAKVRANLAGLGERLRAAQRRSGDDEKIRGMLAIVRSTSAETLEEAPDRFAARTSAWLQRANAIERSVRLAETQDPSTRKKSLARLRTETDALVSEVIEAITRSPEALEGPGAPTQDAY